MLLTDEEITLIVRECARGSAINRDGSTSHRIARAIEAAVVAKLREQEPVDLYDTFKAILLKNAEGKLSYYNQDQVDSGCSETANKYSDVAKQLKISLFLHPAPIPEGWQLVPIEPTDKMWFAGVVIKGDMAASYKAMLAAARSGKWKT